MANEFLAETDDGERLLVTPAAFKAAVTDAKPQELAAISQRLDRLMSSMLRFLQSQRISDARRSDVRKVQAVSDARDLVSEIQEIVRSAKASARAGVAESGETEAPGPFAFAEKLKKANPHYAQYSSDAERGAAFADEAKRVGAEMQRRFLPKPCTEAAPVRPHKSVEEDFAEQSKAAGKRMRGE